MLHHFGRNKHHRSASTPPESRKNIYCSSGTNKKEGGRTEENRAQPPQLNLYNLGNHPKKQ